MGLEIEIKAHLQKEQAKRVTDFFSSYKGVQCGSTVDKEDYYWSDTIDNPPLFRTRLEKNNSESFILVTSKPDKSRKCFTEFNRENEFKVSADQWDNILNFIKGLNLVVCRKKHKKGCGFLIPFQGLNVHVEILEVDYLGWFVEMEITSENNNFIDKDKAEKALYALLQEVRIPRQDCESKGYNKLLEEVHHERG